MKLDPRARSIGIGLLCLAAFALRAWNLPVPTITHPEAFTPGIDFPAFAEHPIARHTFSDIVRSTWSGDNHPPGYYFFMLLWTSLFGTSLTALRLPSAIVGALTVALLFAAVRRMEGLWVATLSATWLAFHGHHVFWSTQARMWVMCTALVVVSVWAATELRERYRPGWAAIYVSSVVSGLWMDYSFWPIFAAQIVWESAARGRAASIPPTLALQGLALALASPVFMFLFSQIDESEYLRSSVFQHLLYTAGFGRWFDTDVIFASTVVDRTVHLTLAVCGAILMALGIRAGCLRESRLADDTPSPRYLTWALWLSILLAATLVWGWRDLIILHGRRSAAIPLALPLLMAFLHHLASRHWSTVRAWLTRALNARVIRPIVSDACVMHSLAPLLVLCVMHPKVPSLAPRALLVTTPFLLVLAARGLGQLLRAAPARDSAVVGVGILGVISALYVPPPPCDYKALAEAIDAARKPGDVLVIEDTWYAQPLHYYLRPDRIVSYEYTTLGTIDGRARFAGHVDRAWVVGFGPDSRERVRELSRPLTGYRELQFVSALEAGAALMARKR